MTGGSSGSTLVLRPLAPFGPLASAPRSAASATASTASAPAGTIVAITVAIGTGGSGTTRMIPLVAIVERDRLRESGAEVVTVVERLGLPAGVASPLIETAGKFRIPPPRFLRRFAVTAIPSPRLPVLEPAAILRGPGLSDRLAVAVRLPLTIAASTSTTSASAPTAPPAALTPVVVPPAAFAAFTIAAAALAGGAGRFVGRPRPTVVLGPGWTLVIEPRRRRRLGAALEPRWWGDVFGEWPWLAGRRCRLPRRRCGSRWLGRRAQAQGAGEILPVRGWCRGW